MGTPRKFCLGCSHLLEKHGPKGCRAHTMIEGYRGPDGLCQCKKFVGPDRSNEKRKAIHQGQIKAAFAAARYG